MNYIEKLFKQYPFVYHISEDYYVFGTGICIKLNLNNELDKSLKDTFELYFKSLKKDLEVPETEKEFKKVIIRSRVKRDKLGYQTNESKKFEKFEFNDTEIKKLEEQIKLYIECFQKYC